MEITSAASVDQPRLAYEVLRPSASFADGCRKENGI